MGPLGSLTLDLAQPFAVAPLGTTDGTGSLELSFGIPPLPASPEPLQLHGQAVSVGLAFGGGPPTLDLCVSNAVTVTVE